ncbi:hypothetical protein A2853_03425 [Candidatus Kaiserbacteria bacterium RIFCSPHIGHO2_01_FULL_55_17]|uniref:Uncharacterized protein n=1 Tax=Candidatus Kaiserbacteria bacterium RIFCSPHIGHO2_01_FULL_55_17 TaxID=1798484 RepID=A0A1F6D928_9BACT|nr:MAG: hypothetical protein A2853_03425 [Candidatus Kaiserbacteria bacterium RIFCSPHIGHO2_01_FULL_55_17]
MEQTLQIKVGIVTTLIMCGLIMFFTNIVYAIDEAGMISYGNCQGVGGFVPLECFQGSAKLTGAYYTEDLAPFINKVFVGAISLGAILAVLRLAWAGFVYMGTDMWGQKEKAKEIIRDTLLGLFLLLAVYLILKQINPDILSLNPTKNIKSIQTSDQNPLQSAPGDFFAPNAGAPYIGPNIIITP